MVDCFKVTPPESDPKLAHLAKIWRECIYPLRHKTTIVDSLLDLGFHRAFWLSAGLDHTARKLAMICPPEELQIYASDIIFPPEALLENNLVKFYMDNTKPFTVPAQSFDLIVSSGVLCMCEALVPPRVCGGIQADSENLSLFFTRVLNCINTENKNSVALVSGYFGEELEEPMLEAAELVIKEKPEFQYKLIFDSRGPSGFLFYQV